MSYLLCVYLLNTFNSTAPISIYLIVACLISIVAVVMLRKSTTTMDMDRAG